MGLDTTHDAFHGPYSSFRRFREWLAARIGIDLEEYAGYGEKGIKDLKSINHPLRDLFDHSDCDGELTPIQCLVIADGLQQVLNCAVADYTPFSPYQQAIQFRTGCLAAAADNEPLEFK